MVRLRGYIERCAPFQGDRAGALRQVVSKTHVWWMFRTTFGGLVFGGLAHMGRRVGELLWLEPAGDEWSFQVLPLASAPSALLFESDSSALVASGAGLARVARRAAAG